MSSRLVARVAVNVRLYFDVPVSSDDEENIQQAARAEIERVAAEECIQVARLHYAAIYPADDWPALSEKDFQVCDISPAVKGGGQGAPC